MTTKNLNIGGAANNGATDKALIQLTQVTTDADGNPVYASQVVSVDASGNPVGTSGTTATVTSVDSSNVSAQMLAANTARKSVIFKNTDANVCYVKFGTTASSTDYTFDVLPGEVVTIDRLYTGRIDAIWAADGSGALKITEIT